MVATRDTLREEDKRALLEPLLEEENTMSGLMVMGVPPDIASNFLRRYTAPTNVNMMEDINEKQIAEERKERFGSESDAQSDEFSTASGEVKGFVEGGEEPNYHDKEVKRILRKVDWRLPPILAILYLFSFLDRGNSEWTSYLLLLPPQC